MKKRTRKRSNDSALRIRHPPSSRSSAPATTISRTSTSAFRSARSRRSPASRGSGKSSLVEDILYSQLAKTLHRASTTPGAHDAIRGVEQINKVIRVDQQPLGNTPTSNPATYTGVFDLIRQLFAQLPEAKLRGYTARRFSFNVPGGRCEACEGNGQQCIQMHFLPDVWVECETCRGQRYNPETLDVRFHGKSIADVLAMSCGQAVELFANIPKIRRILQTLCDVGLDYLTLGQSAPTLSGGEAQRVKLAAELARPDTGQTLYLLDEPTTGLHFDDLAKLLDVLNRLVDQGNTVVVIEHNLDVIKTADWVIDLGPEAGAEGGYVVAEGTPEQIVENVVERAGTPRSERKTARLASNSDAQFRHCPTPPTALAPVLAAGPFVERKRYDPAAVEAPRDEDQDIDDVGRDTKMPWEIDGRGWHTRDRVGRNGEPCKWDGRILDAIERRIHELGEFSDTNWNNRTIVEITAAKKSDGWFFHAITGERWLVKLKFRTAKRTFERDTLVAELGLKPLNDLDEIEAYGRGPRVKCKNLRGPWQEVQIDAHSWAEIDTPEFWSFVERAVAGFDKFTERVQQKPEDVMPWTVLGQKWHLSKKGFPPGKQTAWKPEVLEELLGDALRRGAEGAIPVEQPGAGVLHGAGRPRAVGRRVHEAAGRRRPDPQRAEGGVSARRRRRVGGRSGALDQGRGPRPGEAAVRVDRRTARRQAGGVFEGASGGVSRCGGRVKWQRKPQAEFHR